MTEKSITYKDILTFLKNSKEKYKLSLKLELNLFEQLLLNLIGILFLIIVVPSILMHFFYRGIYLSEASMGTGIILLIPFIFGLKKARKNYIKSHKQKSAFQIEVGSKLTLIKEKKALSYNLTIKKMQQANLKR